MTRPRVQAEETLVHLGEQLAAAKEQVPLAAVRFHSAVHNLEQEIEVARRRRWPFRRHQEVVALEEKLAILTAAGPWLVKLFAGVSRVLSKIRQLENRVKSGNEKLASWIAGRCTDWEAALEQIHHTVPRPPDVARATKDLEDVERTVDLHDDSLRLISRATDALDALAGHGLDLEGAELSADLPAIVQRLLEEGPTRSFIDDLEGRVRPLERLRDDQPTSPPNEYTSARKSMDLIERWVRRLREIDQWPEEETVEFDELELKIRRFGQAWKQRAPEEAEELQAEADDLLGRIEHHTAVARSDTLDDLLRQVHHLTQICGTVPEIQEEIKELKGRTVELADDHLAWWSDLETTRRRFLAEAENHRGQLEKRLAERQDHLETVLKELEGLSTTRRMRARLPDLRARILGLARSSGPEQLLRDLHDVDRIEEALAELRKDMTQASEELGVRVRALAEENRTLCREARAAGISARELGEQIRALAEQGETGSLEDRVAAVGSLEAELASARAAFVIACRNRVEELVAEAGRLREALEEAAVPLPDALGSEAPDLDVDVEAAAGAVSVAADQLESLRAASATALCDLRSRGEELLATLERLDLDALRPGDREVATSLTGALSEALPSDDPEPIRDIQRLTAPIREVEAFLSRLARREQEARRRLKRLTQGFDRFQAEGFHLRAPALSDRLEGLIRGIPENPRRWDAVHDQLDRAETLLARLELHGRHLMAADLDRTVRALEDRTRRRNDTEAEALLQDLDATDGLRTPPLALRRRAEAHLARSAGGDREEAP